MTSKFILIKRTWSRLKHIKNPGKKEAGTGRKDGEHGRPKYANADR